MSDDSDTRKKEDPEAKKSGVSAIAKSVIALFAVGIVTSAATFVTTTIMDLRDKVRELELDRSKWGTLTELHNKQNRFEIELEVTQRVFEYEFGRKIPKPRVERTPPENPATEPPIEPPRVRAFDPEEYRQMQQQKYGPK